MDSLSLLHPPYNNIPLYNTLLHGAFIHLRHHRPRLSLPLHAPNALLRSLKRIIDKIKMDSLHNSSSYLSFDRSFSGYSCLGNNINLSVCEEDCASWDI